MASSFKTLNDIAGKSILIIAFLSFCWPSQVWAEGAGESLNDGAAKKLGKLEEKFFQHAYSKDETQDRLERLEKLVFGAPRTGALSERLNALVEAVPINQTSSAPSEAQKTTAGSASSQGSERKTSADSGLDRAQNMAPPAVDKSEYPAVTAMERKAWGKDYVGDAIDKRLARLETKYFGRPSTSTDLSERVDRLKQSSGVDIARMAPANSDWADDEDGDIMPMPPGASNNDLVSKPGEDGKSFSGRDLRADMHKAFGGMSTARSYSSPSGSYGMGSYGSGSSSASGAYGFGGSSRSGSSGGLSTRDVDTPPTAPTRQMSRSSGDTPVASVDLPSQVTALEKEIFGKAHNGDPLLTRLNRLEAAVFPQQKPKVDEPLPDRVQKLLAVVPVSEQRSKSKRSGDDDLNLDDVGIVQGSNGQAQSRGGLGKIIKSMSGFFSGGAVGGYPMQSGAYITDPQTGMLIDQYTGNMIDPSTGVIMGTRSTQVPLYGSGMGMYGSGLGNYGSFGSFNNGFAPFGNPYGGYGTGPGVRFGFGGGRMGGFWP